MKKLDKDYTTMTKKQKLEAIIQQLEAKNADNSLAIDLEIADLKKEVEDLEEIKRLEEKMDELGQHLPSQWKNHLIISSAITTPLLIIVKVIYDYYWKYQTQQNLAEMMARAKENLKKK